MPPKRNIKSTSRKNTPVSPPKPVSSAGSPKQTRRSSRGASGGDQDIEQLQRTGVELGLQRVTEANEDDSIEVEGGPVSESSAYTSDSEQQLENLDSDFIIDSLADLHRESSNIIHLFRNQTEDPYAFAKDLEDVSSKIGRRLRQCLNKYIVTRESFGGSLYIHAHLIVRKLRDGEVWASIPDGKWRPDAILYLANLAQLLASCFIGNEEQINTNLQNLRKYYPQIFSSVDASSRFRTTLADTAVEFSNSFRTQFFVHETRHRMTQADFDPDVVLRELFPDSGPNSGDKIAGSLLPAAVEARLREIRKFVTTNSRTPVRIGPLENAFPWNEFLTQVIHWAVVRSQELEAQIAAQGGVDNIINCIQAKDFTPLDAVAELQTATARAALRQALPIDPQLTQGTVSASKRGGRARLSGSALNGPALEKEMAHLKNLQRAKAAAAAADKASTPGRRGRNAQEISQSPILAEAAVPDEGSPTLNDEDLLVPTQLTAEIEETLAAHARESNKENIGAARQRSFLDKQSNARKVPFNETRTPQKRQRPVEESDDEDAEFEKDQRPVKHARKGKGRARVEQGQASTQPIRSPFRPMPVFRPPPSSAPAALQDDDDEFPRSQSAAQANAAAKKNVQAFREHHQNADIKVQIRKPWQHAEINRLMELIELNGPKYAKILQQDKDPDIYPDGPLLEHRNQVQLKDKARNIKLDFIK